MSSDYSEEEEESSPNQPAEVLFFDVHVVSLPLNFTVIANPIMMKAMNIPESGAALIKGPTGKIVAVKAVGDSDCPQTDLRIPRSILLSLDASVGDSVPMLAFNGTELCDAIKIQPLFEAQKNEYSDEVTKYIKSESHLVAPDMIFYLNVNNSPKPFLIQHCIPDDRCFTSEKTRVFFSDPPEAVEEEAPLPIHFSDLVLRRNIKETIRNCLWLPIHEVELFDTLRMPVSNGVMVYGSPGNGKTSFLYAISKYLNIPTKFVNTPKLMKYLQQSNNASSSSNNSNKLGKQSKTSNNKLFSKLQEIFHLDDQEKCLIVFDDIDSLVKNFSSVRFAQQRRLIAQFYSLLDNSMKKDNISIIASARSPSDIDDALIKPGRFNYEINLDNPTIAERNAIIKMNTRCLNIQTKDINMLASQYTAKMSRSEIVEFCNNAINKMLTKVNESDNNSQGATQLGIKINGMEQKEIISTMHSPLISDYFDLSACKRDSSASQDSEYLNQDHDPFANMESRQSALSNRRRSTAEDEALEEIRRLSTDQNVQAMLKNLPNKKEIGSLNNNNIPNNNPNNNSNNNSSENTQIPKTRKDPFASAAIERRGNPFNSQMDDQPQSLPKSRNPIQDEVDNPFAINSNPFGSSPSHGQRFPTKKYVPPT
ncbi:hypothetical protein TRFO_18058 [Tritrichomonas foetus]|uniref:AAA+ ATPase domain-containing protein n=1 Tax=Tritrichomonas foetus TaxID=1144522 RepID=A0A1J4KM08_9EUKA|nr:hypothetical protein TRFO_18058 [Tritrichomonas foetus]|eukprot:OHT12251.1 hypothetical protein TRFO_18058 [Tritrichomonas foetus]